jgi:hypothetical protein
MNGRAFLASARLLLTVPTEENRRSAVSRAYYALVHEGEATLERWGFPRPAGDSLHTFVRRRFASGGNLDLRDVSRALDDLSRWRNSADYRLASIGRFGTDVLAQQAIDEAADAIQQLDDVEADPARRAACIAALRVAWP